MRWLPHFALYGTHKLSDEQLDKLASGYRARLVELTAGPSGALEVAQHA